MGAYLQAQKFLLAIVIICLAGSCSGGGGSSDGGNNDGLSRGTDTAIRIIHAGIDLTPVDLSSGPDLIQSAHYGQTRYYRSVPSGSITISVNRSNDPTAVLRSLSYNLKEDTEYSLFIYGQEKGKQLQMNLVEDNAMRPEKGFCLVRVVNGYIGEARLSVRGTNFALENVKYGSASDYTKTLCPQQSFSITFENQVLNTGSIDLPDGAEATILLLGSKDLGLAESRVFVDLD